MCSVYPSRYNSSVQSVVIKHTLFSKMFIFVPKVLISLSNCCSHWKWHILTPSRDWKRFQLVRFTINDVTKCTAGMRDRWQQVLKLGRVTWATPTAVLCFRKNVTISWATREFFPYFYVIRKKPQSQSQRREEKCYCSILQCVMRHNSAAESCHIIQ
jgi:hypothetical protein